MKKYLGKKKAGYCMTGPIQYIHLSLQPHSFLFTLNLRQKKLVYPVQLQQHFGDMQTLSLHSSFLYLRQYLAPLPIIKDLRSAFSSSFSVWAFYLQVC